MSSKRYIIVGDVHGCIAELRELLEKVDLQSTDTLIFCGDLIDKGEDSSGVVKYVRKLSKTYDVVLVLGNHEEKFLRWVKHVENERLGIRKNPMKDKSGEKAIIHSELSEADVQFLQDGKLFARIDEHNVIVVHAGIPECMDMFHFSKDFPVEWRHHKMDSTNREFYGQLLRTRFVNPKNGYMVALGAEKPGDFFWADKYNGFMGHVIFGHQPYVDSAIPVEFPHASGIDLGTCYGGTLCAVIYEMKDEKSCRTTITVPAKKKYATSYWEENA